MKTKLFLFLFLAVIFVSPVYAFASDWTITLDKVQNPTDCEITTRTIKDGSDLGTSSPWYNTATTTGLNCDINHGYYFKWNNTEFIAITATDESIFWGFDVAYLTNGETWDSFVFSCSSDTRCELTNIAPPIGDGVPITQTMTLGELLISFLLVIQIVLAIIILSVKSVFGVSVHKKYLGVNSKEGKEIYKI